MPTYNLYSNNFGWRYENKNEPTIKVRCDVQKHINSHKRGTNKVQVKMAKNSRRINRRK